MTIDKKIIIDFYKKSMLWKLTLIEVTPFFLYWFLSKILIVIDNINYWYWKSIFIDDWYQLSVYQLTMSGVSRDWVGILLKCNMGPLLLLSIMRVHKKTGSRQSRTWSTFCIDFRHVIWIQCPCKIWCHCWLIGWKVGPVWFNQTTTNSFQSRCFFTETETYIDRGHHLEKPRKRLREEGQGSPLC